MSEIHQYIAVHTSMYQYILVYTSTYYYILVHTCTYQYSLTAFYENILKKTNTTSMPESAPAGDADADVDAVKSPSAAVEPLPLTLHRSWPLRLKPQQRPPKNRRRS